MHKRTFIKEVFISCLQIGIFAIILIFVLQNTIVVSGSMEPTLMTHDIAIFNKLAYVFGDVERGDIINFWSAEYEKLFSKRVIGISGDTIEFRDGYVYINGQKHDESPYIEEDVRTYCFETFIVPEGTVFVMGDNREHSIDSRFFENPYISLSDVKGKLLLRIPNPFK